MKKTLFITLFLLLSLFLGTSSAGEVTMFGPKQYLRTTGDPNVYTDTFSAIDGEATLTVKNGDWDGGKRITDAISSASVSINGEEIFGPDDFSQQVYLLEAPINLAEGNSLLVELASNPGSYLTIEVVQYIEPPTVTISAVPESIHINETSTLSWTSTNADSATIDQGIGDVDVNGSTTVSLTETTTYTITAINLGGTDTDSVTVTKLNTAPVADPQLVITDEDTDVLITLTGSDVDGDEFTYQVTSPPANGTLTGTAPELTYKPGTDWYGTDTFTFTVNDGTVDSAPATVTITVNPVNDPPVANAGPDQIVFKDDEVLLDGSASSDVDVLDSLTYQWAFLSLPAGSTATLSDSTLVNPTFVPDVSGAYEVQLIVNDGTVDSLADTVVITANLRIVQVPDVVGVPQADAEASITAAGLAVGTVTTAQSPTVPVDHVISQNPAAGASVEEYSPVDLVVSLYIDSDGDGLSDSWELDNFGNLDQTAVGDHDRDGLTNLQEYLISSNPVYYDTDNDDDGLLDSCELNYFGNLSEVQERDGDYDADGVTNNMECEIGTDPGNASDRPDSGYHYKYNAPGRLEKVYVVPEP